MERSIDQLVNTEKMRLRSPSGTKAWLNGCAFIDALDEDDRNMLIHMIDAMLTKQKMKEIIGGKEKAE